MLSNLKVSTRLVILIGALSILLFGIGAIGLIGISQTNSALKSVYEDRTVPAAQLGEIRALILRNRLNVNIALVTPTADVIKERSDEIDKNIAAVSKVWDAYMATYLTPEERQLAMKFTDDRKTFVTEGLRPVLAALSANDTASAQRLVTQKLRPLAVPVESGLDALINLQIKEAEKAYAEAAARYAAIRVAVIGAIVVGLVFAIGFGVALVRGVTGQLGGEPSEAAAVAQRVASGELSGYIPVRPSDRTSLMAQLSAMQKSLAGVVATVRENAESVATASGQIAQGNQDLSSRTEEQASALEQTAASMEQLGSTVRQNADNARQADQLAQGACTVAIKGGDMVNQVVDTMKGINDSSKKIADIIGVIDGIAFQTNILALNAAVEAARAGEQGRGFAVVASEVRSLAQRSADAAKQIKALIMASVERVEQGTALVDEAGTTMQEIVASIKRVTDIMGEISSASAEQNSGVTQVGEAVSQMDQATQQNAALVEQSAAAAESLKEQARRLVGAVAVFKLPESEVGPDRGSHGRARG